MKTFLQVVASSLAFAAAAPALAAPVPPVERLLPKDTLAVIAVADYAKADAAYAASAGSQLWKDPAMKPFRDKFVKKFTDDVLSPLERELGIKFADYSGLARGPLAVAILQNGWQGKADTLPGWVFLFDSRDKSGQLATNLTSLRKKWTDAGKSLKAEKIRDIEFVTVSVAIDDITRTLERSFSGEKSDASAPASKDEAKDKPRIDITLGQADTLFLAASTPKVIERILAQQAGAAGGSLAEEPAFEKDYQARFRNALTYGWINFKPVGDIVNRLASEAGDSAQANNPMAPAPSKVVSATGILGLKTLGFLYNETPEGSAADFFLGIPAAERKGLFSLAVGEPKDSNPPPFVPADAVKFQRFRLDLQKGWNTIESTFLELSPQAGGFLKLMFDNAGKDKDPNFDLRKDLIGNLGDDIIGFENKPRDKTFAGFATPPSLTLVGSPNAEKLAASVKMIASLLPPPLNDIKEREFLGKKIYSFTMPGAPGADGEPKEQTIHFAASAGYVAGGSDAALLEAYLRNAEGSGKSLKETAGLADAAQKVGGMGSGLFGYENTAQTMRSMVEALKGDPDGIQKMLDATPLGEALGDKPGGLKDWVDFSLLPSFDQIAKYFHFTVYAGNLTPDGLALRVFSPTPPQLKK